MATDLIDKLVVEFFQLNFLKAGAELVVNQSIDKSVFTQSGVCYYRFSVLQYLPAEFFVSCGLNKRFNLRSQFSH